MASVFPSQLHIPYMGPKAPRWCLLSCCWTGSAFKCLKQNPKVLLPVHLAVHSFILASQSNSVLCSFPASSAYPWPSRCQTDPYEVFIVAKCPVNPTCTQDRRNLALICIPSPFRTSSTAFFSPSSTLLFLKSSSSCVQRQHSRAVESKGFGATLNA